MIINERLPYSTKARIELIANIEEAVSEASNKKILLLLQ